MSLLAALALGAGAGVMESTFGYYNQKNLARQQQANYQKNLKLSQKLNIEAQKKAIEQSTTALKNAGLSPVLAAGGDFSAPAASAPLGSASAPPVHFDFASALAASKEADLLKSQEKLNEAAAKKAEAEAKSTEIENEHTEHQDKALGAVTHQLLEEMYQNTDNPFMRGFLDTYMGATSDRFNLGDYEAFNKAWFEFSQRERDRELDFIQKEFDKRVLQMQYENGAAAALADMPKAKRYEIYTAVHQMNANIARLDAETSLTEDQRANLRAQTSKLGQEVMSIFHSDPAAMYKAGDMSALLVGLGYDAVKAAAAGAGFAAGAAVTRGAGAAGAAASGSRGVLSRGAISSMPKAEVSRQLELSRNEIKALKQAAKSKANNAHDTTHQDEHY